MKSLSIIVGIILTGLLLSILICCKKETPKVIPTLKALAVTNITANSATSGGEVTSDGGATVTAKGFCWSSTNITPTIADNITTDGSGLGLYSSSITGLTAGTTYNIRAYATNSVGTAYYSQTAFETLALAPVLTTTDFTGITANSFNCGGNITNDGGSPVTARGVCWSTNQNPSINDNKTSNGNGIGIFTSSITGLIPGTTYYFRAYATNSIGTTYGNQLATKTSAVIPTIATTAISNITAETATSGGKISSDGGETITSKGVCWSTTSNPTTADNKTVEGTGTGTFTSSLAGLTTGKSYYVRAYATNTVGTAYGNQLFFDSATENFVSIPDAAFKTFCLQHFDTNSDGKISRSEAEVVKEIDCSLSPIYSLEGIQFFTSLTKLVCETDYLTNLDVSKNKALVYLWCPRNDLNTLDVTQNILLEQLYCHVNNIVSLDVSKNKALKALACGNNNFNSLDISNNPELLILYCYDLNLTNIDLSKNLKLSYIACDRNKLSSLDLSKHTKLSTILCYNNLLTSLDVSNHTELKELVCDNNLLTSVNLNGCNALTSITCDFNKITSLTLSSCLALNALTCGSNDLISLDLSRNTLLTHFLSTQNPHLTELWLKTGISINYFKIDTWTTIKYK